MIKGLETKRNEDNSKQSRHFLSACDNENDSNIKGLNANKNKKATIHQQLENKNFEALMTADNQKTSQQTYNPSNSMEIIISEWFNWINI